VQWSGEHMERQQVKAGWLGFSASIATGIGGCLIGRYAKTINCTRVLFLDDVYCIFIVHGQFDYFTTTTAISFLTVKCISTLCLKKIIHYNFNAHQPILVIFGRDVAESACYQIVILLSHLS